MVEIDAKLVAELRRKTGAGMMDCKKALTECGGDPEKATDWLRAKGQKTAAKKAGRAAKEGFIGHYVHHNGRLATMVEIFCETDFVARNAQFRELARNLAMHVAAATPSPMWVTRDQVPADVIAREKAIYDQQVAEKPEQIRAKIVEGKLATFYKERVLLDQPYAMDPAAGTVADMLKQQTAKLGENILVRRFVRLDTAEDVG